MQYGVGDTIVFNKHMKKIQTYLKVVVIARFSVKKFVVTFACHHLPNLFPSILVEVGFQSNQMQRQYQYFIWSDCLLSAQSSNIPKYHLVRQVVRLSGF